MQDVMLLILIGTSSIYAIEIAALVMKITLNIVVTSISSFKGLDANSCLFGLNIRQDSTSLSKFPEHLHIIV